MKCACLECGDPVEKRGFCGKTCRNQFNNRRLLRGAELFDLFMALRYERELSRKLKVWKALCRLAIKFRDEDLAERAGRPSWRSPLFVLSRHAYLAATPIADNIAGARR